MAQRTENPFTSVQAQPVESNVFDLSHDVKLSMGFGDLVPVTCIEVLPGDTFRIDYANLFRFQPLISPVMHRVKLMTEYFFVPNRILWDGWEDFITGVGVPPEWPYIQISGNVEKNSLFDYLGVPPGSYVNNPVRVSALPFAAYLKIWDDWYRYAPVIPEVSQDVVSGSNVDLFGFANNTPLKRAWEHDYFTSALPDTQQGAQVDLPLFNQGILPVTLDTSNNNQPIFRTIVSNDPGQGPILAAVSGLLEAEFTGAGRIDPNNTLIVDVMAEAATINDLREAFALQAFLERTLRGGERYIEQIWAHFNVKSSDARLQRPEFLGRSVQNMTISEVLSTAQSANDPNLATVPVGQMAGHGISTGGGSGISFTAEEHGFVIGIVSCIPETAYQDGLHRMFFRQDRYDYAWPSFASLGERPILRKELICHDFPAPTDLDAVFGYIPQYSEYRYHPSRVCGDFRDDLSFWTLSRIFDPENPPELNEQFISVRADAGLRRIFAVNSEQQNYILGQILNKITVKRRLPRFGVPQLVG
jgi:hypothetical protein